MAGKYRLVTRSDFDGLVCAVLLKELDMIDDIVFVHPKDMQDGRIHITTNDITTNLPFCGNAYLSFDHHESETIRIQKRSNHIIDKDAPSAARVVYNYYKDRLGNIPLEMMQAVDKGDSADFTFDEVLNPSGWNLLNFIMDARTGLGRFKEFRISNYQLMMELIECCKSMTIDDILKHPDVLERTELYFKYEELFKEQIAKCSGVHTNVALLDLRKEDIIYPGNRFMLYTLYPQANISMHILWGLNKANTVFAVGKSIFNKTSQINIGELLLKFGGGGHIAAGTCQVENSHAQRVMAELLDVLIES